MRLKSEIWVKAYIRRCAVNGAMAVVARHGDDDAGAIFLKILDRDGMARIFIPASAGRDAADYDRRWVAARDGALIMDKDAEAYLQSEVRFDPDIWIVDVEDADGRHLLGEDLLDDP